MHTREEYVELGSLRRRIVLLADLLGEEGGRVEREQDIDERATAFKEEIERRLASGPATPMDFSALKESIREEAEKRKAQQG